MKIARSVLKGGKSERIYLSWHLFWFFGQKWPFKFNLTQQTISEEFVLYLLGTISICYNFYFCKVNIDKFFGKICTAKVKIFLNVNNSQVTYTYNSLVGTSEAIRLLNINRRSLHKMGNNSHSDSNLRFKQWLAGLIDSDGCFLLSKKGYASLEITMDVRDERALQTVKNIYGGSIKLKSGANALRYRLHHKEGLLKLINDVNGHIRNSYRLIQLDKICTKYDITLIYPLKLTYDNGWFSGFFDGDGDLNIQEMPMPLVSATAAGLTCSSMDNTFDKRLVENKSPQLVVSVTSGNYNFTLNYKEIFGGNIDLDRNGRFIWSICSRDQVSNFLEYVKKYPLRSDRHKRFFLVPKFWDLLDINPNQIPKNSMLSKAWSIFNKKFNRFIHTTSFNYRYKGSLINSKYSNYTSSKKLIVWGFLMGSGVNSSPAGWLTKQVLEMYKFSNYQASVVVGILLSDAWFNMGKGSKNPRLGFQQSLDKSFYVWEVFIILSPFCQSLPNLVISNRKGKLTSSLSFYTRALPCLKKYYWLFYSENKKTIPENIYNLLSPIALAHLIQGDGQRREYGLVICTDSFTLKDVVRLVNVLILRYKLICTIRENKSGQFRIYISSKSMSTLRSIVLPYFVDSMLYKLNVISKNKKDDSSYD